MTINRARYLSQNSAAHSTMLIDAILRNAWAMYLYQLLFINKLIAMTTIKMNLI